MSQKKDTINILDDVACQQLAMTKQQIATLIWDAANDMRSKIEASEYKDYILGFIFYRFLSENEERYLVHMSASEEEIQGLTEDSDAARSVRQNIGYFIEHKNLFSTWLELGNNFSAGMVRDALNAFSRLIDDNYRKIFNNIFDTLTAGLSKLGDSEASQSKSVRDLIHLIKIIPIDDKQGYDILGFIYEYLISNFAANAGKKAGEFYTPHEVSVLMSEIVSRYLASHGSHRDTLSIFDPTSGSGSLLINIGRAISKHMNVRNGIRYYAQEYKENTYNLTRMNLVMRGVVPGNIYARNGDTLDHDWPFFEENDKEGTYRPLMDLDAVVSNPPYSQKWNPDGNESDPRYAGYGLAPRGKSEYAFLLHSLYHLDPDGIMTIVLPHGVLFRGNGEDTIREKLIENNNIDAIIGLPANIFFGTGIPTIIMVLKKRRSEDDVLIIDASKEFVKEGKSNKLRAREIKKISDVYAQRLEIEKYSRRVPRAVIRENNYNLNIPRYVDSSEKAESYDLYATMYGGIPKDEIDYMSEQFETFSTLRNQLFTESSTPYVELRCGDVKKTINEDASVKSFREKFRKAFDGFEEYLYSELIDGIETVNVSSEEEKISDEIFRRLESMPLIDKYNAYQILDDNWTVISADLESLHADGMAALTQIDPIYVSKKKDGKRYIEQKGWKGHIIPLEFVQQKYMKDVIDSIAKRQEELDGISSKYDELIDKIPEDEIGDFLNDDNSAFDKKEVESIVSDYKKNKTKPEAGSVDEIVFEANTLIQREKDLKKQIKESNGYLVSHACEIIEGLDMEEALSFVSRKWVVKLCCGLFTMSDVVISTFESKVNALVKKYSVPLTPLEKEINDTEKIVADMLDNLEADEYDLLGLKALKKLFKEKQ